jgi:hypothetical protein
VKSVKVAGALDIDTGKIGKIDGLTLVDALRSLQQAAGRPVALIVDEAQHALTSEAGEVAMHMTRPAMSGYRLVPAVDFNIRHTRIQFFTNRPFS